MKKFLWMPILIWALGFGLSSVSLTLQADPPVALVADLEGACLLQGKAVDILQEITSGQFLDLAEKARLTLVYFESGHEYTFNGASRIYIREDQPVTITGQAPTQRPLLLGEENKKIRLQPGTMVQAAMVMRNLQPDQLTLSGPKNTKISVASPQFSWQWTGQPDVEFRLVLDDPQYTILIERGLHGRVFQLPAHIQLKPHIDYVWRIEALTPQGNLLEVQSASFNLLTPEERQQVQQRQPAANAPFSERLVYAVWLKQLGLQQMATDYFTQLAQERAQAQTLKKMATTPPSP